MNISGLSASTCYQTVHIGSLADQVIRTTEGIVNSSAIQLATDIRAIHVFESCDVVSGLGFPFAPSCGNFESSLSC